MQTVRPPAVAGMFYPSEPVVLTDTVTHLLASAEPRSNLPLRWPKALIVPHAGYIYSGPIAASAYAQLQGASHIQRVVLIGPAHRVAVHGLVSPGVSALRTPAGDSEVDSEALAMLPEVVANPRAHAHEHSLEVQLPFLQKVVPHAKIVPLIAGFIDAAEVGAVLESLWGGRETVIVISSDLSHYLPYREGQNEDRHTADRILSPPEEDEVLSPEQACGCAGINGLLWVARRRKLSIRLLDLRNSGDTAGDKAHVVGYGAFALYEDAHAE